MAIEALLDRRRSHVYDADLFHRTCDADYQHVFDADAVAPSPHV